MHRFMTHYEQENINNKGFVVSKKGGVRPNQGCSRKELEGP